MNIEQSGSQKDIQPQQINKGEVVFNTFSFVSPKDEDDPKFFKSRRGFLKLTTTGASALALGIIDFTPKPTETKPDVIPLTRTVTFQHGDTLRTFLHNDIPSDLKDSKEFNELLYQLHEGINDRPLGRTGKYKILNSPYVRTMAYVQKNKDHLTSQILTELSIAMTELVKAESKVEKQKFSIKIYELLKIIGKSESNQININGQILF